MLFFSDQYNWKFSSQINQNNFKLMRKIIPFYVLIFFAGLTNLVIAQSVTTQGTLKTDVAGKKFVEIILGNNDLPASIPIGGLYSTGDKISKEIASIPAGLSVGTNSFRIYFPDTPHLNAYDPKQSYEVLLVFDARDIATNQIFKRRLDIPVRQLINVELARQVTACSGDNNLQMIVTTPTINSFDWQPIYSWLDSHVKNRTVIADLTVKQKGKKPQIYKALSLTRDKQGAVGNDLGVCLVLDSLLPTGPFDATLVFSTTPPPPSDIKTTIVAKRLEGTFAVKFPEDEEQDSPEKRKLENTIDFGASFISSVTDQEVPATVTTVATTVRKRDSIGVFDLGFEYPEILHPIYQSNKWMTFVTPFFFKATVSTEKIDKNTSSQNRILFGFQGESRYRQRKTDPNNKSFLAVHRIEWGLTHASDRDFKQKEIYSTVLYKPIIDRFYKPLDLNYKISEGERISKGYGFTFAPLVGFDFGRTYSRRNPAAAIKPSNTVKRFNFGLKLGLDLTSYISLTAENILFVRLENPEDRLKNLFKAQGEFKLFRTTRNRLAHSLFVTYEKGQGPPFASPDVNSVRMGYRVIGNFCGIYCR